MRKGKEFIFPENVDKNYGVWKGLTLVEILIILFSFVILSLIVIAFPPYNLLFFMLRIFVFLIPGMGFVFYAIVGKPVKHRPNIKFLHHYRVMKQYDRRQHLFFIRGNRGEEDNENIEK